MVTVAAAPDAPVRVTSEWNEATGQGTTAIEYADGEVLTLDRQTGKRVEPEYGECPTCGPDQEADADGRCSWCGRGLSLGPDYRSDPGWWRE